MGPTLPAGAVTGIVPDAVVHPPVAHGDLLRLEVAPADVVVLVDGYYHHSGSVRHKEILELLASGVRVVGCASLGALRAAELHLYGMVGHGVVFGMYRDGVIDSDAEVAVAHGEAPEYRRLGEPLVSIRHAAAAARTAGVLSTAEVAEVVATARAIHYTARAWPNVELLAGARGPDTAGAVGRLRAFLAEHPEHGDVKAADATDTLHRLAELTGPVPARHDWVASTGWRTFYVDEWRAAFAGSDVDGERVGPAAVLRYQQLYHPGFPDRWRAFVLHVIAGVDRPMRTHDPAEPALTAAAAQGLRPESLDASVTRWWLTARERSELAPREALLRVLVRSYRPARPVSDLAAATPDLVADHAAWRAVAESYATNERVAAKHPLQSTDRLKQPLLRAHLESLWDTNGEAELDAAARDRGFGSARDAVAALRPYFLRSHFAAGAARPEGR